MRECFSGVIESGLVVKYRNSWLQATEEQRQAICSRLGLQYTHINDEALLQEVAHLQQTIYLRNQESKKKRREQREQTRKPDEKQILLDFIQRNDGKGRRRKSFKSFKKDLTGE
jgi:hypothetical protein